MKQFGIIGFPLSSSFSMKHFNEKFDQERIDAQYGIFPIENIELFPNLIRNTQFSGMNVTIPYKQQVIPYLDELDDTAQKIGAVNVIKFDYSLGKVKTKGYNSDAIGFELSLLPLLKTHHTKALILGTGGASKAVAYVLTKNNIDFAFVSRTKTSANLCYKDLTKALMEQYLLIINCTPLGMYPVDEYPDIPYEFIGKHHLLYDLIYNPPKTLFLAKGEAKGADIKNGLDMLLAQAKGAWEVWNS